MARKPSQRRAKSVAAAPEAPAPAAAPARPGWTRLDRPHLPQPTYWPAVLALGISFIAWGLVTSLLISLVGLVLLGLALAGWIGELRHDH